MTPGRAFPTRTCVGCGARDAQAALVRLTADGESVTVRRAGAAGRSAYVHGTASCIAGLVRSKGLGRSLRATIAKDARRELAQMLEARRADGTIGIAANEERTLQNERIGV